MNNEVFAPIIIPTLCRFNHFKLCVESLAKCTGADKTELIIGVDYPAKDEHWEGYNKIISYVDTIKGFRKLTILRADHNLGPVKNSMLLSDYAYRYYDRVIKTEDDNEFSPNFIEYINKALDKYRDDERVVVICGYNYPIDMAGYSKNVYASHEHNAWGAGYWKAKEWGAKFSREYVDYILHSYKCLWKLFWKRPGIIMTLINMMEQGAFWGDTCRVALSYLEDKYTIGPTISKVRNHGHDGSGVHCAVSNRFEDQEIDTNLHFDLDEIPIKAIDLKAFNAYFAVSFKNRLYLIKRLFKYYLRTNKNVE